MQPTDRKEFITILKSSMEVFDKSLSVDALEIWWATMIEISMVDFRKAMTAHVTTSQFAPKPADILNQFKKHDGRPGAEEAWAMTPKSEADSVIWTQEIATAFGAACPLIDDGDMIGARMVFKEAYQRELDQSARTPVKWIPSFGTDKAGREKAVTNAVSKNRISVDRAVKLLPGNEAILSLSKDYKPQLIDDTKRSSIKQLVNCIIIEKKECKQEQYSEEELLAQVKLIEPRENI